MFDEERVFKSERLISLAAYMVIYRAYARCAFDEEKVVGKGFVLGI